VALFTLLGVVVVARVVAIFTLNVNWDEFALLQRAVLTARTGDLVGGGRPGLATLVLVPFAAACRNAVDAVVQARLLWTAMVMGAAVTFWYLLRQVLPPSPHRRVALATGLGLWVLAPPFLHSSTQVRTDQPAILFGLMGGLALLASRDRAGLAAAAGALFGIGFLFSQKLLYVGGLVAVLALGHLAIRGDWRLRREGLRAGLAAGVFLLVVLAYRAVMDRVSVAPAMLPVAGGLRTFEYYGDVIGWRYYRQMAPVLLPQGLALAGLVAVTLVSLRDRARVRAVPEVAVAWAVAAVGVFVLLFHAGRFPYFYMTLGLFPACVGALVAGPILDLLPPRGRIVALGLVWVPLAALAAVQAGALTDQTQHHQRASLEFVERSFPPEARGFEAHAAFACRRDPDPFRVRFAQSVRAEFGGEDGVEHGRGLVEEFRARPVVFLILPPTGHRYPAEAWEFWRTRYVRYHGAVHVPGYAIRGGPGWSGTFEVLRASEYTWRAMSETAAPLEVGGRIVESGATVALDRKGIYPLRLPEGGEGMLVLALPEPPAPDSTPFYRGF
jgi:hypothetical protein